MSTLSNALFNQRIAVQIGTDGHFNIGTNPNSAGNSTLSSWDLMYSWPGSPWSSFTTIRIDGTDFIYGSSGTQLEAPNNTDAHTNRSSWQINDIKVTQVIQLVPNPQTGQEDLARIAYTVQNLGSVNRSISSRVLIDTEINYNDGAVFRVPGLGVVKTETDLTGTAIPDSFQSFFSISDSQHTAVSVFKGEDATVPDRLILAQWRHLYSTSYTYTVDPSFDFTDPNVDRPDSAYAAYWNPVTLAPRAEQTYITYYGLSQLTADLQPPLELGVNGPATLAVRGENYSPDTFQINATVSNSSATTVDNVELTLALPPELTLVSGPITQSLGSLNAGQESAVTWIAHAIPQQTQATVTYAVTVSGSTAPAKTVSRSIQLPRVEPVTPLIFVPGIMGSYLDKGNCNLWPHLPTLLCPFVADLQELSLDFDTPEIIATDAIRSVLISQIYQPILAKLTNPNSGGYVEATNGNTPLERCQNSSSDATLYVFAYDWRKSNDVSADKLKELVDCVRQNHPGSFVNILTHSMGGLVARRYILKNMDTDAQGNHKHYVNTLVTIAAPWLGAPKSVYVLRHGTAFDDKIEQYVVAHVSPNTIKALVKTFPSSYELLPSKKYFEQGGQPVRNMDRDAFEQWLNQQFADRVPGPVINNNTFHTSPQDDWRADGDNTGVNYYHIYGRQSGNHTIETITPDVLTTVCSRGACHQIPIDQLQFGEGDGTVPILSASRISGNIDLNAQNDPVTLWLVDSPNNTADAEHTGMTANVDVQECALAALQPATARQCPFTPVTRPNQLTAQPAAQHAQAPQGTTQESPEYALTVHGVAEVTVSDPFGNTTDTLSGTLSVPIPDAVFYRLGDLSQLVLLPTGQPYTVTLRVGNDPLAIELTQGTSSEKTLAVRYQDLELPPGAVAMLRITPQEVEDLRYDTGGNGVFDHSVTPTVYVTGAAANDTEPPAITLERSGPLEQTTVTLTATDAGTGVNRIKYSLDGTNFQLYTGPFQVNTLETPVVYAFADDNVANRSSLLVVSLVLRVYLPVVSR